MVKRPEIQRPDILGINQSRQSLLTLNVDSFSIVTLLCILWWMPLAMVLYSNTGNQEHYNWLFVCPYPISLGMWLWSRLCLMRRTEELLDRSFREELSLTSLETRSFLIAQSKRPFMLLASTIPAAVPMLIIVFIYFFRSPAPWIIPYYFVGYFICYIYSCLCFVISAHITYMLRACDDRSEFIIYDGIDYVKWLLFMVFVPQGALWGATLPFMDDRIIVFTVLGSAALIVVSVQTIILRNRWRRLCQSYLSVN